MVKETFYQLLDNYTPEDSLKNELWQEIVHHYSDKKRHYHSLNHLDNLLVQLTAVKEDIKDWDTLLFTLFYHDIIYDSAESDNEEKSAELATMRLKQLGMSKEKIDLCKSQILATKTHQKSDNTDTNYFLDADLSILGQNGDNYLNYSSNVRKEYSIYPENIYNQGRKKVLNHFLTMNRIFKTDFYFNKFEKEARKNILNELNQL